MGTVLFFALQALPCGHVVCLGDLLEMTERTCPECGKEFPSPGTGGAELPTIFALIPEETDGTELGDARALHREAKQFLQRAEREKEQAERLLREAEEEKEDARRMRQQAEMDKAKAKELRRKAEAEREEARRIRILGDRMSDSGTTTSCLAGATVAGWGWLAREM